MKKERERKGRRNKGGKRYQRERERENERDKGTRERKYM